MFRRIGNWLNGDSIAAELVGVVGGMLGGQFGIGRNRGVDKLMQKLTTHLDGDKNNNVPFY